MNTPRQPNQQRVQVKEEQAVVSFTRVIAIAPRHGAFDGWGPSRWN